MTITSPPYEDTEIPIKLATRNNPDERRKRRAEKTFSDYGLSQGQVGKLKGRR